MRSLESILRCMPELAVPLTVLAVAGLVFLDIAFGVERQRPEHAEPQPLPAPAEPSPAPPGCTAMPNGILVCDPEAESGAAHSAAAPQEGWTAAQDAYRSKCVAETTDPRPEAVAIVDSIVAAFGVVRNFAVREGRFVRGCIAVAGWNGTHRYIVYDREHFTWRDGRVRWDEAGIMAHEIAHLLMSHWTAGGSQPSTELEADRFAGFAVSRLGGTLAQALSWTARVSERGGKTHPPRSERIRAVALGWGAAELLERFPDGPQINLWLGEPFGMGDRTCRLGYVGGEAETEPRIACEEHGRWRWF